MEKLNAWGAPYKMCVYDRAYGDYLTKDEVSKILKAYRCAGIKRFHYMMCGYVKKFDDTIDFYSYRTKIFSVYKNADGSLHFTVYRWLSENKSATTYKQINRFLYEMYPVSGFSASRLAAITRTLKKRGYCKWHCVSNDVVEFFDYQPTLESEK